MNYDKRFRENPTLIDASMAQLNFLEKQYFNFNLKVGHF